MLSEQRRAAVTKLSAGPTASVAIPNVLRPYMGGMEKLSR